MKARRVAGFAAMPLLAVAGCGSSADSGDPPQTTVRITAPSFITIAPVETTTTTTTTTLAAGGVPGAIVPGEQLHRVVLGDFLYGIADTYCVDADAIPAYNSWSDGLQHELQPGTDIRIPPNGCVPGSSAGEATEETDATPDETSTTYDPSAPPVYIVELNDTLSGIAAKTGTTVEAIVAANNWADENQLIYPGMKISLPAKIG